MSMLKKVISEMASAGSTGAGAVGVIPGSLFGGGYVNSNKKSSKKTRNTKMFSRMPLVHNMPRLAEAIGIDSDKTKFNAADVISKLDAAEKKAHNTDDTTAFGLEDEKGNIVKVYVRSDQADQFERSLGAMLGGADDNSDDKNSSLEIAEVLFDLKGKFDIIDVDWGQIEADEEEEQQIEPGQEGAEGENPEDDMTAQQQEPGQDGAEGDLGLEGGASGGAGDEDVKGLLQQVIDVMKANADAQKAEADARTAEAKAKEADFISRASASKVKQEEEILDMETYNKRKADEKKEAQKLAKLAKFKHDQAKEADDTLNDSGEHFDADLSGISSEESEERTVVSPRELAAAIFRQLKK